MKIKVHTSNFFLNEIKKKEWGEILSTVISLYSVETFTCISFML